MKKEEEEKGKELHVLATYRGVCVQVGAQVLDLELELLLCPVGGALLYVSISISSRTVLPPCQAQEGVYVP